MGIPAEKTETHSVAEAKERLRSASGGFDPCGFIREKPLSSVGGAFLAGLVWSRFWRSGLSPGLLSLSVELLKRLK